jgi:hypothetical protein
MEGPEGKLCEVFCILAYSIVTAVTFCWPLVEISMKSQREGAHLNFELMLLGKLEVFIFEEKRRPFLLLFLLFIRISF